MANLLGWKDILRPIRDGYRHLFPSPDTGPSAEERAKQRRLDQLKGFMYFDTFAQLDDWDESKTDAIQRSNTPLLPRSRVSEGDGKEKARVLLCHDYSGNYHEYEAAQGVGVDVESYSCENLQFVDAFIYFSHKLACVPPPTWTNALHRNGVKALGTFLIEPQTKDTERLLHRSADDGLSFPLAKRLAQIAAHCGFDGWLVNIEKPFPKYDWDHHVLDAFLRQLSQELGSTGTLIWYDALTTANKVDYQNALSLRNLPFSRACGNILTNYCWKEADASDSKRLAEKEGLSPSSVFFGVDVWAQNATKLTHPRVTYPEKGGGGTRTGVVVSKLADMDLSVGIFGPAWTFEHFPGHGRTVERAVWDGVPLPDDIECSCGTARPHHLTGRGYSIKESAQEYAAGSNEFLYTDFSRAFGVHASGRTAYGDKSIHSQLGSQSLIPQIRDLPSSRGAAAINVLSQHLEDLPGHTQLVVEAHSVVETLDTVHERSLAFFKLDMVANGSLRLKTKLRCGLRAPETEASLYLKFDNGIRYLALRSDGYQTIESVVAHESQISSARRLLEIGIHVRQTGVQAVTRIVEVLEICIAPHSMLSSSTAPEIEDIRVESRGEDDTKHRRLCWKINDMEQDRRSPGVPYSEITGHFSHFLIEVGGFSAGTAHALEFVLTPSLLDVLDGDETRTVISGIGFDGQQLARGTAELRVIEI